MQFGLKDNYQHVKKKCVYMCRYTNMWIFACTQMKAYIHMHMYICIGYIQKSCIYKHVFQKAMRFPRHVPKYMHIHTHIYAYTAVEAFHIKDSNLLFLYFRFMMWGAFSPFSGILCKCLSFLTSSWSEATVIPTPCSYVCFQSWDIVLCSLNLTVRV